MKSYSLLSKLLIFPFLVISLQAHSLVLSFEDTGLYTAANTSDYYANLTGSGYGGLVWSDFYIMNTDIGSQWNDPNQFYSYNGYVNGTTSGTHVAMNPLTWQTSTINDNGFDFNGVYLTAAWHEGLMVDVIGSLDGQELYSQTVILNPHNAQWFDFNYTGIDTLSFNAYGGTSIYGSGSSLSGTFFVMDDFTFNQSNIPEPDTLFILLTAFVLFRLSKSNLTTSQ